MRNTIIFFPDLQDVIESQNSRQNLSKNKLVCKNGVDCGLRRGFGWGGGVVTNLYNNDRFPSREGHLTIRTEDRQLASDDGPGETFFFFLLFLLSSFFLFSLLL